MNNKLTIVSLFIIILAGISTLYYFKAKKTPTGIIYRIAIFEPASHPAMDEIAQGFIDTMKKNINKPITFDRYNANGDKTLLRSQAEEIIQNRYDLIMPIGATTTRTLHELTTKKSLSTPIVFTAVSRPVELGIIASTQSSGNHLTGIEEEKSYQPGLEQLLKLKPSTKHILIVYNPAEKSGNIEHDYKKIETFLKQKKIKVTAAQIYHANEIQSRVQPLLSDIDVIMVLIDHTVVSGIDSLINLCNRYSVTLFASDLPSGDKGAAIAFGVLQYEFGAAAATMAIRILNEKIKPTDIPVIEPENNRLKINTKTMEKQGLYLSPEELQKIKAEGGIVI